MRTTDIQPGDSDPQRRRSGGYKFLWLGLLLPCMAPLWMAPLLMAQARPGQAVGQLPDAPAPQGVPVPCAVGACSGKRVRAQMQAQAYQVYTTRQLARMAVRDVADPFNLLSVVGSAAIVVGSDSHSIYGPGWKGLARASGVGLTEDMTDEFFGTFLIPSLDHQEPGFERMPHRPIWRRLVHCATGVVWTRSQTGQPMFNYSNVVGNIAEQGVAVTYVPFRRTGWGPAAERVGLNYATDPIGNLIDEFVPQVASHINVRVVFFQNIINRVATTVGQRPSM